MLNSDRSNIMINVQVNSVSIKYITSITINVQLSWYLVDDDGRCRQKSSTLALTSRRLCVVFSCAPTQTWAN